MKKIKLLPIDIITFCYIAFNLLYILLGWSKIENPILHFSIFSLIILIILLLAKYSHINPILSFIRDSYPVFIFLYFFNATMAINKVIFPEFIDGFFQKIDLAIFGYQPSIIWGKMLDSFFIQELMHFAYFSYYLMFPILGFTLYFKDKKAFRKFIFALSFVFYFCYATYNILPVVGGRYWDSMMELTRIYRYGIFSRIMAGIYTISTHKGGAFPSSHVAISVVLTISAIRNFRWLGYIYIPLTFLLIISTVYCHYHYFIDAVFGIIYAFAFYYLSLKLYHRMQKNV